MPKRVAGAPARTISADEAAGLVRSGMWLDFGFSHCQPDLFDRALAARVGELEQVKVRSCLSLKPRAVLEADPDGRHVFWFSWHFSGHDRRAHDRGCCHYLPINLGEAADYYRRFLDPVDIVVLKTCPMDRDGWFNFGPTNAWHGAVIERAKTVIVETSEGMPYVCGEQTGVHVSEVDYIVEGDSTPPAELLNPPPTEVDRAVARRIASEIDEGACLQIGIGAMPNAVCSLLMENGVRDLGVHTEMMIDGIVDLYRAGLVTGTRKKLNPGKLVYTFAVGSRELYAALDRNPDFHCCPSEYTNSPTTILQNDRVIAINNTTQIDLQGQAASESDGHRHISGTGGQLQFVRGAYLSSGGKSFICLASTYDKRGERRSRIVLNLTPGNVVTTPRTDMMYVVTEYGMACLKGKSVAERARAIISLAHPDFREDLERQAHEHRLIPRGFVC
jgi:acyl-CoA hydrolase